MTDKRIAELLEAAGETSAAKIVRAVEEVEPEAPAVVSPPSLSDVEARREAEGRALFERLRADCPSHFDDAAAA